MTSGGWTISAVCPICLETFSLDSDNYSRNPAVRPITEINPKTNKFYSCVDECSENCQTTSHKCANVFHEGCLLLANESHFERSPYKQLDCAVCKKRISLEYTKLTSKELTDFDQEEVMQAKNSEEANAKGKIVEDERIKQEKAEKASDEERKKSVKSQKILIAKIAALAFTILAVMAGAIVLALMFL